MFNAFQFIEQHTPIRSRYIVILIFILGFSVFFIITDSPFRQHSSLTINSSKPFHLKVNYSSTSSMPTLCMIIRIYEAQIPYFPVLALALHHTGLNNIRLYLTNTDKRTNLEHVKQTIKFINELVLRMDFVTYLDLGEPPSTPDFGYEMTDRALAYLYKNVSSSSLCHYVTVTNGDNFYSRNFAKQLLPHMKLEKDIIGWGFVSHHYKPHYLTSIDKAKQTVPQVVDDGTEKCTPVELKAGFADLGAVAYRFSFLQKFNLFFGHPVARIHLVPTDFLWNRPLERRLLRLF